MSEEYRALVAKVEAFTSAAFARRRADMACRSGCDGCCMVWLTVSPVEAAEVARGIAALDAPSRRRLAERGARERDRERSGQSPARCAMLEDDGRCLIYAHRPLVCRTQGHALLYPPGVIPEAAVRARTARGEITHCPLNFTGEAPRGEDALDAERVDQILALVNHRFAEQEGVEPHARRALSELAAEADVLER